MTYVVYALIILTCLFMVIFREISKAGLCTDWKVYDCKCQKNKPYHTGYEYENASGP